MATTLDVVQILNLTHGLIGLAGGLAVQIALLKGLAKQAGATNEQLAALDVRLTAALAALQAEQAAGRVQ